MSAKPLVWAEIRLDHLVHNLKKIRRRVGPDAEVLAVVKADAYGHGMVPVARALAANGVRFFGVVGIDEAVELRRSCPAARILVLGPFHPARLPAFFKHRIVPTVSSLEDVRAIEAGARHAAPLRARIPVHVKIDTGMGRLGVWHEETLALFRALGRSKSLVVEGLYTHLAQADAEGHDFTRTQLERFERALGEARALGLRPEFVHAANSVGGHRFPYARYNLVRAGILLYGLDPSRGRVRGLKPVMSLKARVSFLKDVGPGRPLSYGGTYRTKRRTRIAVLPVGYSHGYRVGFSNRARVLIGGRRYPVVGRVTMDQILVDVGPGSSVKRWDTATLLGGDGPGRISAEELAEILKTIPYEVVCSVHSRIPRIYKGFVL